MKRKTLGEIASNIYWYPFYQGPENVDPIWRKITAAVAREVRRRDAEKKLKPKKK